MSEKLKIDGPFDPEKTLECGQTFFRNRTDGGKYYTVRNGGVLKVWQEGNTTALREPRRGDKSR